MDLYIIRHAPAEDLARGQSDEARALTPRGRKRFRTAVKGLKSLGVSFSHLLHSPALRALETAELLEPLVEGETIVTPLLLEAPSDNLLALLNGQNVALVGHQPWLSMLTAWLITGSQDCASQFDLRKGGVVHLTGNPQPSHMALRAFLPPSVLRTLAL